MSTPSSDQGDDAPVALQDVFVLSGVPTHTFVAPVEYARLLVALRTPGRSVVIEGPSGIGKTTAAQNAITEAGADALTISLSARKKEDLALIADLPNQLPFGTVLIDDFHRLSDEQKLELADLMKTLADQGASHSKLVVIGINNAGQTLISFGRDLANRIDVIPFEANPEYKIEELVKKGESALNIGLAIRDEIVKDAQGSFYLAQMLAYEACLRDGIYAAAPDVRTTEVSYEMVKAGVMAKLARSFHSVATEFARGSKLRREGRAPYLHLLYWLSQSKNWAINASREATLHPEQRGSVSQVVTKGFLGDLVRSSKDVQSVLHYDSSSSTLVVQDPQFVFYIRNISWPQFAEEVGFLSIDFPSRYDFALSFAGSDRSIAELLFLRLQDDEFEVFYDRNEQARILAEDVEEYLAPIYASDAAIVVCILGPEYPKRVWTRFESKQFRDRFKTGEVVPVVLDDAPVGAFDEAGRVGHIGWSRHGDQDAQGGETVRLLKEKIADVRTTRARKKA
ncbi:MAG: TIR domain-containing protein [Micropruina sp.]|uniref:TIR domain-containing protein n=1 Tax=Micropruina sp. TaxID=2737536 RepID=UPI0039E66115